MSNDRTNGNARHTPSAVAGFESLSLHTDLLRAIQDLRFERPTTVQTAAIPAALAGRDLLASASTGSGKTAAFLLPILDRLLRDRRGGTRALVLTPTRELAAQVADHFAMLAKHTRLRCIAVYGGVGMQPQEAAFRRGVDLMVATPGRLLDHMQHSYARLPDLDVLVLDEADRMLDMGFLPDVRRVLRQLPDARRQTMLFSATLPPQIVALSRELMRDPTMISTQRKAAPAKGITQALFPVASKLKAALLLALLERGVIGNAIVFCRTKHRANRLAEKLGRHGIAVARIHGNRSQKQRTEALAGFRDGRHRVLVATDIVARGIDVEALEHVVNFDVPNAADDYIHRVGRTARADATGDAYTLVAPEEEADVRTIERGLGRRIERRSVDGFDYHAHTDEKLEVPLAERIAAIRTRKGEERARARAKAAQKTSKETPATSRPHRERGPLLSAEARADAARDAAPGEERGSGGRRPRRRGKRGGARGRSAPDRMSA